MENSVINRLTDTLNSSILQDNENANVGKSERIISVGAGAFIALKGITNVFSHPFLALTELGLGSALLYRGLTGYCPVKEKLDEQQTSLSQGTSLNQESSALTSQTVPTTAMPEQSY
jgi:hypothetical protein